MYYSSVTAGAHKEFFKNHKKMEVGRNKVKAPPREDHSDEEEKEEKEEDSETDTGNESTSDVYKIVNPIATSAGPIGQFIPTPDAMPNHPSIVLFGKRRTGKSFSLRSIMYHCFRDVPFGKFMCLPLCFA